MLGEYEKIFIVCAIAIGIGILFGNSAVWFFNRIPAKWLCDYDEEPDEELLHPTHQRVRSTPWKYFFTAFFIIIGIKLGMDDPLYGIAVLVSAWLLLEMSISDIKYRIVPDQFIMLLILCGIGYIPYQNGGPFSGVWGALAGFGVMLLVGLLGKLMYRKDSIGGGDIKLFAALGVVCGLDGIVIVFILTALLSGAHFCWLLMRKRIKPHDKQPMVPYISTAALIYLVILHEISYNIMVYL